METLRIRSYTREARTPEPTAECPAFYFKRLAGVAVCVTLLAALLGGCDGGRAPKGQVTVGEGEMLVEDCWVVRSVIYGTPAGTVDRVMTKRYEPFWSYPGRPSHCMTQGEAQAAAALEQANAVRP